MEPSPLMVTQEVLSLLAAKDSLGWGVGQEVLTNVSAQLRQKHLANSITWSQLSFPSGGLLSGREHLALLNVFPVNGLGRS